MNPLTFRPHQLINRTQHPLPHRVAVQVAFSEHGGFNGCALSVLLHEDVGGVAFEVYDDVSPTGRPGGLAMTGRVRNWASFETPNGKPMFRMKSQPDPDFTPEQRATAAKAAGVVVSMDADSRRTFAPGCATSPSDGPEYPQREDGASAGLSTAQTPEAA